MSGVTRVCLAVVRLAVLAAPAWTQEPVTYEFRGGRWFDGSGFVTGSMYARHGAFVTRPAAGADSVVDLSGYWMIPPYGEAHNHNIEAGPGIEERVDRYLREGVFYVKNPNVLPRSVPSVRHLLNHPTGLDVTFAFGGFTGPGGHPIGVVRRNVERGLWKESDGDGAFYYAVRNRTALEEKWPALLARQPDFVKAYLLYSEEHARRADDPAYEGQRGLDPALLPALVELAHEAGLRVSVHVETAADFRHAVDAGADEIAHLPGFRGNEQNQFPDPRIFLIDAEAARGAHERGTVVVTTLGDFHGSAPEDLAARADSVFRSNLTLLREYGVPLAIGSDGYGSVGVDEAQQLYELGVFDERELLKMWVETTPATIFPNRRIGRLEPGFEASFLALGASPLEDFSAVRDVRMRIKSGRVLPDGDE